MQPYYQSGDVTLYSGDLRNVLPALPECSVDCVVTDPPYGYSFMGKDWDHSVPGSEYWKEVLRVCKPGAILLAFGGTRTFHRLTCAIEDAGWEIRDCLMWLYGSGFPKSLDISKAIDKAAGAKREVVGSKVGLPGYSLKHQGVGGVLAGRADGSLDNSEGECAITAPATDLAKQWQGYGTALKPSWEPIILAMKPLDGTFANNAEKHGVAGLNIDACRIATEENLNGGAYAKNGSRSKLVDDKREGAAAGMFQSGKTVGQEYVQPVGRFPANLLLDEEAAKQLDEQTGTLKSGTNCTRTKPGTGYHGNIGKAGDVQTTYGDSGGASRFYRVISCQDQNHHLNSVNTVEIGFNPQSVAEDSVLALAVILEHLGETVSNEPLARFIADMRNVLSDSTKTGTQTILSSGEKCVQESKHMLMEQLKLDPVNCAEISKQTNIITTIQNLLCTSGFVDLVMSSNILKSWAVGEVVCPKNRFKYCAKASKKERGDGNDHSTVKPLSLMEYLLTLCSTPTGGVVLDPFAGSGTTLVAAKRLGRTCIGVELLEHNCEIAKSRISQIQL
jgi:site-specific DNA-methyltransferase (adenine-specific)